MIKKFFIKLYKIIEKLLKNMEEDHISEYSSQCAYYTILSFIPFTILLITMVQYTNISKENLLDIFSRIIPANMDEIVLGIVQEVYSKSIGTISISIVFTLWSAGKGLYALTKGIQSVYHVNGQKEASYIYLRIKAIIETIIFIILIALGLTFLVFGSSLISIIKKHFGFFYNFNNIYFLITEFGFIFATFLIFLLIYKFMPRHRVKIKSQIMGAFFGAISLNIVSFVFSRYLDIFKGFSITYGSLTTLMLVMMWTYSCFYTVFLGAEINKVMLQNPYR